MEPRKKSGQGPFVFSHCADLGGIPPKAETHEVDLHGTFAVDKRSNHEQIYYGMPGYGLIRVSPDLTEQALIELPPELTPVNFHSTKIGEFDGNTRLFLSANNDEMVAIVTLEGDVDFVLPRPAFDAYQDETQPYKPTDTTLVDGTLYIADGYGSNYILSADMATQNWLDIFGGKTDDSQAVGKFGTAHGMNRTPQGDQLAIADRPHARFELYTFGGERTASYSIPAGSKPCGIDYLELNGRWYAVVGSLDDPIAGRAAPIYILDAEDYKLLSTIRPQEELGIERTDHIHNVVWHVHDDQVYLICQSWNPGRYFVLDLVA